MSQKRLPATGFVTGAATALQNAGADFFLLCTNTMHRVADRVTARVTIPLLHIVDATAAAVKGRGLRRVGLLGTRFTIASRAMVRRA